MLKRHKNRFVDDRGATAIEYGMFIAGVGAVVAAAVFSLGADVAELFEGISETTRVSEGAPSAALGPVLLSPLVNGGFEANIGSKKWTWTSLDGWSNSGSGGRIELWSDGFQGTAASEGSTFIELDAHRRGGIDHLQTSVDLVEGKTYNMSFDHAARSGAGATDSFEITHNGTVIATIDAGTVHSFSRAEVSLVGSSGPDIIGFKELPDQNNGVGVLLDNVKFE